MTVWNAVSSSLCSRGSAKLFSSIRRLEALQFRDVVVRRHADEPARQRRLDEHADLGDVADEVLVDGPHARAAVRRDDDEAFAAQNLQRLAHRVGGGAVAAREVGDDQPLVGLEPALDDVLADEFVNGRAGARSADGIDPGRRLGFEIAHRLSWLTPPGDDHLLPLVATILIALR